MELWRYKVADNTFYEMVKKWTVSDYNTPGIKAEVIIDMLCSEFVADIVGKALGEEMELIAKEFPIPTISKSKGTNYESNFYTSHQSAKVDYLLKGKSGFCFVELKTDKDSYNDEQLLRMVYASIKDNKNNGSLYAFFNDLVANSKAKKKYMDYYKYDAICDIYKRIEKLKDNKKPIKIVYLVLDGIKGFGGDKILRLEEKRTKDGDPNRPVISFEFERKLGFGNEIKGNKKEETLTVTVDDEKRYIDVIFVRLVDEEVLKHQGQGQEQEQQEQQGRKGVEGILIKCLKTEEE